MDVVDFIFLNLAEPAGQLLDDSPAVDDLAFENDADLHDLGKEPCQNLSIAFALGETAVQCVQDGGVSEDDLEGRLLLRG